MQHSSQTRTQHSDQTVLRRLELIERIGEVNPRALEFKLAVACIEIREHFSWPVPHLGIHPHPHRKRRLFSKAKLLSLLDLEDKLSMRVRQQIERHYGEELRQHTEKLTLEQLYRFDVAALQRKAEEGATLVDLADSLGWSLGDWRFALSRSPRFRDLDRTLSCTSAAKRMYDAQDGNTAALNRANKAESRYQASLLVLDS